LTLAWLTSKSKSGDEAPHPKRDATILECAALSALLLFVWLNDTFLGLVPQFKAKNSKKPLSILVVRRKNSYKFAHQSIHILPAG